MSAYTLRGKSIDVKIINARQVTTGLPNITLTEVDLIKAEFARGQAEYGRRLAIRVALCVPFISLVMWLIGGPVKIMTGLTIAAALILFSAAVFIERGVPRDIPPLVNWFDTVEITLRFGDFIGLRVGNELTRWRYY